MEKSTTHEKGRKHGEWLLKTAIIFFAVVLFAAIASSIFYLNFENKYESKIYPNIFLVDINLGGKTVEEAQAAISERIEKFSQSGIALEYEDTKTVLLPTVFSLDPDLAYELIKFDSKAAVEQAYDIGRSDGGQLNGMIEKLSLLLGRKNIALPYKLNEIKIIEAIKENFGKFESPAKNAGLKINNGEAAIIPEQNGLAIDYKSAFDEINARVANLNSAGIKLATITSYPEIYSSNLEAEDFRAKAEEIIGLAPLKLKVKNKEWKIDKAELEKWIAAKMLPAYCGENSLQILGLTATSSEAALINGNCTSDAPNSIHIGLDENYVIEYLKDKISPDVDIEPQNSKFEMRGGKVAKFQVGHEGEALETKESYMLIEYVLTVEKSNEIGLRTKKVSAEIDSVDQVNDLGIKEVIGTGESNFSGSPRNRRHNIRVGADTLHGILIKPDEEFSLVKTLGEIDAKAGYLPELVIKKNKTVPEYGGGLCQIGTTMFRAALATGLPITARTNHSYRVSYYEPAGTDATIYNPNPDFRFLNDTGHHVLIQARIEGDNLYFDFWGTNDGRKIEQTKPTIYNFVKPGPTVMVETTELNPGEKKCTESAHTGADAYFDYKVTYADGTVMEKRFNSHYRPWQAVCLVGAEEKSEENVDSSGTSTPIE